MHIAQLSVAGEEHSRLNRPDASGHDADRQALDEYACDRSNLPWVIFRAAHRANHVAALPARARALLAALARTVDAGRPYAAIFARRELLTGRALQSMRTFYRSLDDLETAGLITRPPQTRYGAAGLFGRAYLHLTSKAASLLGLVEPAVTETTQVTRHQADAGHAIPASSLDSPSVTLADGAIYKDLFPTNQKRQPGRVPADLQRLRILGFRDFLIFKLMREAGLHAKRLSDVVESSWDHLRRATHPISYLRTLLRAPIDFAYRVRMQRASVIENTARVERAADAQAAVDELAGKHFVSHDQLRTYHVSSDGQAVTIKHCDEQTPRVHAGHWIADFIGALRTGRILPLASDGSIEAPSHRFVARREGRIDDLKRILKMKPAAAQIQVRPLIDETIAYDRNAVHPMTALLASKNLAKRMLNE